MTVERTVTSEKGFYYTSNVVPTGMFIGRFFEDEILVIVEDIPQFRSFTVILDIYNISKEINLNHRNQNRLVLLEEQVQVLVKNIGSYSSVCSSHGSIYRTRKTILEDMLQTILEDIQQTTLEDILQTIHWKIYGRQYWKICCRQYWKIYCRQYWKIYCREVMVR